MVSRVGVCVWAVIMGCIMSIAQVAGINVNWLITIIGAIFWQACLDLGSTALRAHQKVLSPQGYSAGALCHRCGAH